MTVLLAQKLVVGLSVKVLLDAGGFALVQSDDVVLFPHFVTVNGAEGGGKAADCREVEDGGILDALVGFAGECRANLAVGDARAAVG
jgi:hypothetical protein